MQTSHMIEVVDHGVEWTLYTAPGIGRLFVIVYTFRHDITELASFADLSWNLCLFLILMLKNPIQTCETYSYSS